jgi:TctA family transporter
MLGAFLMLGIQPGPTMLTDQLPLVWSLIWALAVANIMCAIVLVAVSPWLGALAYMKTSVMVPFVLMFALLGCYLGASAWENLLLLVVFSILGYMFKRHSWPRPPFVIGLVLGPIAEDSLLKAFAFDGMAFVLRPISLILIAMILATIGYYFWKMRKPGAVILSDV